ncbi:MAG: GNAT family N-acetyltransferase [Bacteroidota bacterium]
MSSKPTIRPIQETDNPRVAQIIRQVMTEFSCVGSGFSIEDPEVDEMYQAYAGDRAAFYVIEHNGVVKGCGGFAQLEGGPADVCELKKMYFLTDLRGMGMGSLLVDHCLEQARASGFSTMYLETVERMVAANHLYQKKGFRLLPGPLGATGHGGCDAFYDRPL